MSGDVDRKSRWFVTGGTGFLGSHLIRQLVEQGDEVIAFVFEPEREETLLLLGAKTVTCGFDSESLRKAMTDCDGVFHVAGHVDLNDKCGETSWNVNVEGAKAVGAAAVAAGVKRLVHTSSLVTVGGTQDGEIMHEDGLNDAQKIALDKLGLAYIHTKQEGERTAFSYIDQGLEVVVCNPSGIIGPQDIWGSQANVIFDMYRKNGIPVVPEIRNNWADVRDIAAGHIQAMKKGRSGERYFLGCRNCSLAELLNELDESLGRKRRRRFTFGSRMSYAIGAISELFSSQPTLSRNVAKFSRFAFWLSHEKACRELGYSPRPISDTLRETFEWFESQS